MARRSFPFLVASTSLLLAAPGVALMGLPAVPREVPAAPPEAGFDGLDAPAYEVAFQCPAGTEGGVGTTEVIRVTCPYRILDEADALGSPTIAVSPSNPSEIAIASLHGGGEVEGATPRSRDHTGSGVFTIMTTRDGGYNWVDQPSRSYYPPQRGTDTYGEHMTIVTDRDGHVYGAGVFSVREGDGGAYGARFVVWKWARPSEDIRWGSGNQAIKPLAWPVYVDSASLTYLPPPDSDYFQRPPYRSSAGYPWANHTVTPTPSPTGTAAPERYREAVVATWLERGLDNQTLYGKTSRLRAAWTDTSGEGAWELLPVNMTVGPCQAVSNGVAWDESVYVACVVGEGYNHRSRAQAGQIDLWRIRPKDRRAELVDETPFEGGRPHLAVSADGRFALATIERKSASTVELHLGFSWFGEDWALFPEMGTFVQTGARDMIDARIQAMAYPVKSRVLHLIYQEVYPPVHFNLTDPAPPHLAQFAKYFVTMNECEGLVLPPMDLRVGLVHQYSPVLQSGTDFSLFDDLVDGLTLLPDAVRGQREFFALGDMGTLQFAEVLERNPPACVLPGPPPPAEPPILPLGAGATPGVQLTGAQVAAASGAGLLALAMAARLAATRWRRRVEDLAGSKK